MLSTLPALEPLVRPGMGDMADATLHVYRTVELVRLWQDGVVYSRWAPDLAFGLGYPLYNFYTPLFYYLTGGFHLLGLNFELATKATLTLILLLGCAGMYALAREWLGEAGALLAAVAYTYAPFRLREIYFQGDFAQFLALALPPLILWGLHRLAMTGQGRYLLITACTYAALFLSHSISTMLFTPFIVAYGGFLLLLRPEALRHAGLMLLALALGAGLSAFFWFPALYEKQFVRLDALRTSDFDFRRHFPPTWDLASPSIPLDVSAVNPYQPFNLGLVQLLLALPSLWILLRYPMALPPALRWGVGVGWLAFLGCVFMMLPFSTPVWQTVPLLAFTEFPWRWLGVAALPLAFLAGASAQALPRWRGVYVTVAALVIILSTFPHLYPREPFTRYDQATIADILRNELKTQAIGTTSAGEYLPKEIGEVPRTSNLVAAYLEGHPVDKLDRSTLPSVAAATLIEHRALSDRWRLVTPTAFTARVYTLYYHGWTAYLNQQRILITPSSPEGFITVAIPAGEHELTLRFEDTLERQMATGVSLTTLLLLMGLLFILWSGLFRFGHLRSAPIPDRGTQTAGQGLTRWETLSIGGLALVLFVAKVVYIDPQTSWFRAASDLERIPGLEHPVKVNFDDRVMLLGYTVDKRVARPGESVEVTLFWRALQPLDRQYSAFLHLIGEPGIVTQKDNVHPGGIPATSWRPDQFVWDEHPFIVPPETPPGVYRFRVGLYDPSSKARLPVTGTMALDYLLPQPLRVGGPPPQTATTADYRLGEGIRLVAYQVASPTIRLGETVTVSLYWQARAKIERNYTVFIHLYDTGGRLWGVGDRQPLGAEYPTSLWEIGEIVEDIQTARLDPNAPPGVYRLAIGLYELQSMQRLMARDAQGKVLPDGAIGLQPPIQVITR
jgi:hypothetical protein